ncbi:hypothetical protein PAXRUDRAFT_16543 [Paxillus rubicundulus Ve08.2h10]|uniref:Uncharacterized protein n=1 Tax=Paxillus rubicundulus Ve08.2h10 TaxID=930991 RepID=A0A0D0C7W6_9AGAM|nr:hypothetical protein PAXRUDRAFT_16543 [Paxillus rubicundulus Ve08.2h10]
MFTGLALEQSSGEDPLIGGYDSRFANVSDTSEYAVTPSSSSPWTPAMNNMPSLSSTGTSLAYIRSDAVDAIYSVIEEVVHVKTKYQDSWYVLCMTQTNLPFTFGKAPLGP